MRPDIAEGRAIETPRNVRRNMISTKKQVVSKLVILMCRASLVIRSTGASALRLNQNPPNAANSRAGRATTAGCSRTVRATPETHAVARPR
jgi:hypothetical protein